MARSLEASPPQPKIGEPVGEFVLGVTIDTGPLGVLYAAARTRDDLPAAIRVIPPEIAGDDNTWSRFVAAASGVWQHDRRHIAPLLGAGRLGDGSGWVAYPLMEARTLAQVLTEHPLEPAELLSMLRGVCRALEAAHEHGIFHGALGPASVCISSDSDGRMRAKLLELGAAQLLEGGRTRSGPVARDGSSYPPFDLSRDLRALGFLCFEALSGEPFLEEGLDEPPRISDVRPELGPHFDEPVHSLLVTGQQPESAAEAHARMVTAAREAGYDVGSAIPAAPRNSLDALPATKNAAHSPDSHPQPTSATVEDARVGPVLLLVAVLVLIAVLLKTQF